MDILQGQENIAFSDERVKMSFGSLHAHITQPTLSAFLFYKIVCSKAVAMHVTLGQVKHQI